VAPAVTSITSATNTAEEDANRWHDDIETHEQASVSRGKAARTRRRIAGNRKRDIGTSPLRTMIAALLAPPRTASRTARLRFDPVEAAFDGAVPAARQRLPSIRIHLRPTRPSRPKSIARLDVAPWSSANT